MNQLFLSVWAYCSSAKNLTLGRPSHVLLLLLLLLLVVVQWWKGLRWKHCVFCYSSTLSGHILCVYWKQCDIVQERDCLYPGWLYTIHHLVAVTWYNVLPSLCLRKCIYHYGIHVLWHKIPSHHSCYYNLLANFQTMVITWSPVPAST